MPTTDYSASFDILASDFRRLLEYVEPTDANLSTYSHRLFELLLRTCTDFESACKERLVHDGFPKNPGDMNILDYRTLEPTLRLEDTEVGVAVWRPDPVYLRPFAGWSSNEPPLRWYSAYNKVKHNRVTQFSKASLENAREALAGLFVALAALGVFQTDGAGYSQFHAETTIEYRWPGYFFSIRRPKPGL